MEKIWCQINESLLIIADLTSSNPNVLYELGVAHTLGKPIIMMTQDECYVPTDLKAIDYIRYDRDIGSEEELQKQLKKAITHTITGER
jgi:predicted nucleotide-binding protein